MKKSLFACMALAVSLVGVTSCGKRDTKTDSGKATVNIDMKGSDTMVQLSTAWAEDYHKVANHVQINASGGGSGTGIAGLINGTIQICAASREMKAEEKAKVKAKFGKDAYELTVAFDALAVYSNPGNPIKEISLPELTEIWAEGGSIDSWEQLNPAFTGKIVRVGRQNNSGTYDYFREHICGKTAEGKQREFKAGASELNGSSEVVEQIAKTPTALGYSGMGYKNDKVNWLAVAKKKGEKAELPSIEGARSGSYPIARKLYLYTVGEPSGEVKAFLDWIVSAPGQKIVAAEGFVPLH